MSEEQSTIPEKTPEQIELEAAQLSELQRQSAEATEQLQKQTDREEKLRGQLEQIKFDNSMTAALRETGLKFHLKNSDIKKLLEDEPGFDFQNDGVVFLNGERIELATALRIFGARHANLLQRSAEDYEFDRQVKQTKISAKDQLKTTAEKIAYIRAHGGATYEALPLHAPQGDPTKLPTSEILRLPTAQKVRLVSALGEEGYARLLERNKQYEKQPS